MIVDQLGRIRFCREHDGSMGIGIQWNPILISKDERGSIAKELRSIADALDRDEFEVNGKLQKFPVRKSPPSGQRAVAPPAPTPVKAKRKNNG